MPDIDRKWIATDFGGLDVLHLMDEEVPRPKRGEVTIEVYAAGVNPTDYKRIAKGTGNDPDALPISIGFEVSGVIEAMGPGTEIATGGGASGAAVLAFRVAGGYASKVTVPASDVFAKPAALDHPQAANLLLVGTAAAEMLYVAGVGDGSTIMVHGCSGAVGISVLQQAKARGVRVIGTASEHSFETVRRFGGIPVAYGEGLEARLREQSPSGYDAALDTAGTDEAVDASLALVPDRQRIVTIAAYGRARDENFRVISSEMPASAAYRDHVRLRLIDLAAKGQLVVPIALTFPLSQARAALTLLQGGHPGGKLALIPSHDTDR